VLPRFHTRPINVVVYDGSIGRTSFEVSFSLRCFQRLSLPYLATRHCSWRYNRSTSDTRRSEPSSRTTLIGEQPNPWDLLQPQDVMSRHRGAKHPRRYELLEGISLLSPAYLLSVERWPFHSEPPDHYDRLSTLLDLSVLQSGRLMPLHSTIDF